MQIEYTALFAGHLRLQEPWLKQFLPQDFQCRSIYFDRTNNVWFTNGAVGAWKINLTNGEKRFYSTAEGLEEGLVGVFQDNENNYWFLINGKGVQKLLQNNLEAVRELANSKIPGSNYLFNISTDSVECGSVQSFVIKNKEIVMNSQLNTTLYAPAFYWNNDWWVFNDKYTLSNRKGKKLQFEYLNQNNSTRFMYSPHKVKDHDGNLIMGGNQLIVLKKDGTITALGLPYFTDNIVVDEEK
jgi:hypothetical protein